MITSEIQMITKIRKNNIGHISNFCHILFFRILSNSTAKRRFCHQNMVSPTYFVTDRLVKLRIIFLMKLETGKRHRRCSNSI